MIKKFFNNIFYTLDPFCCLYKRYIKKHIINIVLSVFLMIVIGVSTSCIVYIVGPFVNKVFVEKNKNQLVFICIILISLYAVKTLCCYFQTICLRFLCEKIIMEIRADVFKKVVKMPMKEFNCVQNGKVVSIFLDNSNRIGDGVERLLTALFRDFVTVVFLFAIVVYNNFILAIFSLFVYPVIFVPLRKIKAMIVDKFTTNQDCLQVLTDKLTDVVAGMKTIKSYNNEFLEICKMNKLLIFFMKSSLNVVKKKAKVSPSVEFASGLSLSFVIFVGGWQVISGYSDVGSFFSFFTALIMAHRPARSLSSVGVDFVLCSTLLRRVFSFMETVNTEVLDRGSKPDLTNPTIKFKNVGFSYNNDADKQESNSRFSAIYNVNLEIKPRQKIAFVGVSGSGKSTIVDLLIRLYDYQEGEITINGENIKNIALSCLRKNIACVRQDNFLFNDTVESNILYGSEDKKNDLKFINKAMELAQVDFLSPDVGIKENVGRGGSCFSFGQQQRIAIARAIVKDAPVVIFDEATSALDLETERKIYDVIFNKMQDKTIIIVAHRLSTIVNCDVIYVVNNGMIVEQGTHEQLLMSEQGFYKNLWQNLETKKTS